MEQYHEKRPIPSAIGQALGHLANDAISDLDRSDDPRRAQEHLQRADDLLRQFRCDDHAYRSRLTLLGFEQRLSRFAAEVRAALVVTMPSQFRCERQAEIADHRRAARPACRAVSHRHGPASLLAANPSGGSHFVFGDG
jgi:hypothetical protein